MMVVRGREVRVIGETQARSDYYHHAMPCQDYVVVLMTNLKDRTSVSASVRSRRHIGPVQVEANMLIDVSSFTW